MRIEFRRRAMALAGPALPLALLTAAALTLTLMSASGAEAAPKAPASPVVAGGQGGTTAQPPVSKADADGARAALVPATLAGMPPTAQSYYAVVNPNGSLARGFQVWSVIQLSTGSYQVVFSHDVTGSALIATVGISGSTGASAPGYATVAGRNGVPNGVFIQTFNSSGVLSNLGFHLAVLS